jgi:hypothetical protein
VGNLVEAKKGTFVWTELAQKIHAGRIANEPIWEAYRYAVPKNWIDKGFVKEIPITRSQQTKMLHQKKTTIR